MSLPTRGAWIEIIEMETLEGMEWSLPTRGAWIEITRNPGRRQKAQRRSPHGERGLKSHNRETVS